MKEFQKSNFEADTNGNNGRKLLLWGGIALLVGMTFLFLINVDMELMIVNKSGENVRIVSCFLNGMPVQNCGQEIPNERVTFIAPQHSSYPKNNSFGLHVIMHNESRELFCKFKKISRECIEEMSLTKEGLICGNNCVSVYQ